MRTCSLLGFRLIPLYFFSFFFFVFLYWCDKVGRRRPRGKQPPSPPPTQENNHDMRPLGRKINPINRGSLQSSRVRTGSVASPERPIGEKAKPWLGSAAQNCVRTTTSTCRCVRGRIKSHLQPHAAVPGSRPREDYDTDLSDSEKDDVPSDNRAPPQLKLSPEVIKPGEYSPKKRKASRPREFEFPDFLPPPLNSWSLGQLAVFYSTEDRASPRCRPVGPLERYLDRLLQLECLQAQTVQDESSESAAQESTSSCHRSATATSSRLSSPKCILQCQRAFLFTFLSSLTGHADPQSNGACTFKYPSCCHPGHNLSRQSRLGSMQERSRGSAALPKRSFSESRHSSSDRTTHLKRMQASGNIRNPLHGATTRSCSTTRDTGDTCSREILLDCKEHVLRRRTASERRKGGAERVHNKSEGRLGISECKKNQGERGRAVNIKEKETKADGYTAGIDMNAKTKNGQTPGRHKQVEFVT